MSYPQQESYGQYSQGQGFYESGFTIEGEREAVPEQQAGPLAPGYEPSQQAYEQGASQWAGGEQDYYSPPQAYGSRQEGGYAQQGRFTNTSP